MIRPDALQAGDTVAITALASKIDYDQYVIPAREILESWGLNVVESKSLNESFHGFAGPDTRRCEDFQQFLDDASVKAIFSARGGYGTTRFLDQINYEAFGKSPKWIVGFSDITAVLCDVYALGYESIHGPMPKTFAWDEFSLQSLRKVLFGESVRYQNPPQASNRLGQVQAPLIGGNLCLLSHLMGTRSEINTEGCILFMEDTDEYHYALDRYLVHLHRAGKLGNLAGLLVGSFSDLKDQPKDFGSSICEIVRYWTDAYDFPIAFDFPVGHEAVNVALPLGRTAELTVTAQGTTLAFS